MLQSMKQQAKLMKMAMPHLYDYYNVFGYYSMPTSGTRRTIACVLNLLIVGLNMRDRLLRLVVIMLDKDVIEDVGVYHSGADDIIAEKIGWLFKQIEIAIHRHKAELTNRKPGVVYSSDPKIVIVDMLKCYLKFPDNSRMQGILELRSRYNSIVNDMAAHFGFNRLYIELYNGEYYYDRMGNLTNEGKSEYWNEVNKLIEKFGCRKIKLMPKIDEKEKHDYFRCRRSEKAVHDR